MVILVQMATKLPYDYFKQRDDGRADISVTTFLKTCKEKGK